ncbi:hypothetical protein K2173_002920 [Erythroxylum novogranatense]|uniref:V-SNARE coiled-coil homology domain-containing protein n=1 Tax=Erythroxylum novogranatense TaxID=1862640 RepID=A0AAV8TT65_9ROSI|nr:hypothetical protein K2173_002920 [Erythroxylum novogranatense]
MFARLFQKSPSHHAPPTPSQKQLSPSPTAPPPQPLPQTNVRKGQLMHEDVSPRVTVHYGIPSTASIVAFDPIQSLLALGTLDGRIKVIGGDNIEGLFVSPKHIPFKNLEFLQNQGFLVSVSSENEIQVWDLEQRFMASSLKWESNVTAFSVIHGSRYMYLGDEYGMISVLKYDVEEQKLMIMPYYVPTNSIDEASGTSSPNHLSVVGVLPQPYSQGKRLLIAYEDGLIILWDVSDDKVILVTGNRDLQLKSKMVTDSKIGTSHNFSDNGSDGEQVDKEISSLCWASDNGSVLAVGYVDGDIMLWNLSVASSAKGQAAEKSSDNVVKLQLSSGDRRLPVIVLHWSAHRSHSDSCGLLFVYGGDAIGSEEVLTILSLDWSAGIQSLKCSARVDLTLNGSFADMILLPRTDEKERSGALVLTNPGQLDFCDDDFLSSLISHRDRRTSMLSVQYPMVIPMAEPCITVAKLSSVNQEDKLSKALSEAISAIKLQTVHASGRSKWPLTGGVPTQQCDIENYQVARLYIAGYQDGSVRIWDATYPSFSLLYVLGDELCEQVKGVKVSGTIAPVSALEFCSSTLVLAIGNELGMIQIYMLIENSDGKSLNIITETGKEVQDLRQGDGPKCTSLFSFLNSAVWTLQFAKSGSRVVVGFLSGQVAMLDISSSSVLFLTDSDPSSSSAVKSLAVKSFSDTKTSVSNPEDNEPKVVEDHVKCDVFVMTKNASIEAIDVNSGNKVWSQKIQSENELMVVSMHIIESSNFISDISAEIPLVFSSESSKVECEQTIESSATKADLGISTKSVYSENRADNFLLLLCCVDELLLHSMKPLKEGDNKPIHKVNLSKPCCWATTFKKDGKECGLIVLYQTGVIEIRSLPNLDVVGGISLESILRWNFKTNMDKTITSSDHGQIILANGCEFASLSLLAFENDFRIPDCLPSLHDKVLAAAVDVTATLSSSPKGPAPGILGGFIKNFQAGKVDNNVNLHPEVCKTDLKNLESIFSSPPFLKPSTTIEDYQNVLELGIDDIDIDIKEPLIIEPLSEKSNNDTSDKGTEREKLFEGASTDFKPTLRTAEEIKAKYRKQDASTAAAHARDKLVERQEKLERLSLRSEELRDGAENFASMAHELAKQMEKRKWWNI